ncbi:crossover junction endodeoxyribonuclease RuvC [Candidatus Microgenomates bacterium]|nr:crossover junction endodeoxyribonuclease RuvC [Candidatus Microgenomates bacterium]
MLILGIDPGTATTGFGFINIVKGKPVSRGWGLIETNKENKTEVRLERIHKETLKLLKIHKPDIFAIEKVFFATNAKTAIAVGQAIGVMLLAASKTGITVFEYAPGTIKKMVTGSGRASKKEVQVAVRKIMGNHVKSKKHKKTHFDNAADALAVALTHARKEGLIKGGEEK